MRTHPILFSVVVLCLAVAAPAQAGIRADLSGDAVVDFATTMDLPLMAVGNPGNVADTRYYETPGYGAVDYAYNIGKFEVTAGQYTEFLNAVAATDSYGLYDTKMTDDSHGCQIQRGGASGSYTYSVATDWEDRPVNYVNWGDSVRFANWLTNGMPTGAQDLTTTEDGSYLLNGAMSNEELMAVTREPDARYVLPTEDEWYKAAYHKNDGATGNYWDYATSSDALPSNVLIDPDPGNNANYRHSADGYTIYAPYFRTEAGEFELSVSPYGTFDQTGNVKEWNETRLDYPPFLRYIRAHMGQSYTANEFTQMASYRSSPGSSPGPSGGDIRRGFRIAEVPEPATLSLFIASAFGLLRRRHAK